MPGFQSSLAPRPNLQGESKAVVRWDLMRPKLKARPKPKLVPPPADSDRETFRWIENFCNEANRRRKGGLRKMRPILIRDYDNRHDIWEGKPDFVRTLIEHVARKHNVPACFVLGQTRILPAVDARQEAAYLLHHFPFDRRGAHKRNRYKVETLSRFSFKKIANWTNRDDHTTIVYAVQKLRKRNGGGNGHR